MKIDYKGCILKSLKGMLYGPALLIINLIVTYLIFGQEGYSYEILQYTNINTLIGRTLVLSIIIVILLIVVIFRGKIEDLRRELSIKEYFWINMKWILLILISSIIFCIFLCYTDDVCFVTSSIVVIVINSFIFFIVNSIYRKNIEKKINEKLKNK